jgi:hypothetical protein
MRNRSLERRPLQCIDPKAEVAFVSRPKQISYQSTVYCRLLGSKRPTEVSRSRLVWAMPVDSGQRLDAHA